MVKKDKDINIKGVLNSLKDSEGADGTNTNTVTGDGVNSNTSTSTNTDIDTNTSTGDNANADSKGDTEENTSTKFTLKKKSDDKQGKKAFNVYMTEDLIKSLDKICKKSGYSRNELINLMCQHCVDNVEIV